jgi:dienelactone hydrolase
MRHFIIYLSVLLAAAFWGGRYKYFPVNRECFLQPKLYSIKRDTSFVLNADTVHVRFPSIPVNGQILILPGWNYTAGKCCIESSFCKKALQQGYVLLMPEMGKSIYASGRYPETRKDWIRYPQLKWLTDTLLPYMQRQTGLFAPGQANFVFGISTGGRGVALLVEHSGTLFQAGASLSGDFDQTKTPDDNLMRGVYGSYSDFKPRWEGEDNALRNASKVKVPLYLGHGLEDKVIPCEQTKLFYAELKKTEGNTVHVLHLCPSQGHNYTYWDSETDAVLKFFNDHHQ